MTTQKLARQMQDGHIFQFHICENLVTCQTFIKGMVFGLKHPKFVMNHGPCSQKTYHQLKYQRVTYYDGRNSSPLNFSVLFFYPIMG